MYTQKVLNNKHFIIFYLGVIIVIVGLLTNFCFSVSK